MTKSIKLSVIVTVYNVEGYIKECINSIFKQGLDDDEFELIIVNDGCIDNSMEVIMDIISRHDNVSVLNQENSGTSIAWNNGISHAKGEYVLIVDADDLLIEGKLKPLLDIAIETNVDIAIGDFLELYDDDITPSKINLLATKDMPISFQEKSGIELFLNDLHPSECYVWRKLYKNRFLKDHNLTFIPGIRFQDIPFTTECYIIAEKCIKTDLLLYIYRKRYINYNHSHSAQKKLENTIAIAKTWELISRYQLTGEVKAKLESNIYINFTNFSRRVSHSSKKYSEREYIYMHLRQMAPQFCLKNSLKQRIITFLSCHLPYVYNYGRYYYVKIVEDRVLHFYRRIFYNLFK